MGLRAALHERFVTWALRVPEPEPNPVILSQRRVYVLPTRAGLGFATALAVMLLGAINYNLGLGYALTFLLGGVGVIAIFHTYRNLVRLTIKPGRAVPVFAGEVACFHLRLQAGDDRRNLRLAVAGSAETMTDVSAEAGGDACLKLPASHRGWLPLPRVTIDTVFPLGLIRAWSYCAPDFRCLIYPRPAAAAPPLPVGAGDGGGPFQGQSGNEDFAGLRGHQPADPPRHVAWKIAARRGPDLPLMTKQFSGAASAKIWLDWNMVPGSPDEEARLSILTRWALDAHEAGISWGLRLPARQFAPGSGADHLQQALRALALHGQQA